MVLNTHQQYGVTLCHIKHSRWDKCRTPYLLCIALFFLNSVPSNTVIAGSLNHETSSCNKEIYLMIFHISKCVASKEKIYIYLVSERHGQDTYRGITCMSMRRGHWYINFVIWSVGVCMLFCRMDISKYVLKSSVMNQTKSWQLFLKELGNYCTSYCFNTTAKRNFFCWCWLKVWQDLLHDSHTQISASHKVRQLVIQGFSSVFSEE